MSVIAHHKQWFGNENIQDLLAGPFFGFKVETDGRVVEIDSGIRMWGQFSMRYFGKYIVCAGPLIGDCLNNVLTPEEQAWVIKNSYQGDTFADCIANVFHGEGLELAPGYAEKVKPVPEAEGGEELFT